MPLLVADAWWDGISAKPSVRSSGEARTIMGLGSGGRSRKTQGWARVFSSENEVYYSDSPRRFRPRHCIGAIVRWLLFAIVISFAVHKLIALWTSGEFCPSALAASWPFWLGSAAAVYVAGWLPSAFVWHRLLRCQGVPIHFWDTLRAFYCSQPGKYVPGKALALVIRCVMIKDSGCAASIAAYTATQEVLLTMVSGLVVGLALFPELEFFLFQGGQHQWFGRWLEAHAVAVTGGLSVLALILVFSSLAFLENGPGTLSDGIRGALRLDRWRCRMTMLPSFASLIFVWAGQGASLWFVIRSVAERSIIPTDYGVCVGIVSLATPLGFIAVFAPGGLGVREAVVFTLLRGALGTDATTAAMGALVLRLVWLVADFTMAGLFLVASKRFWQKSGANATFA